MNISACDVIQFHSDLNKATTKIEEALNFGNSFIFISFISTTVRVFYTALQILGSLTALVIPTFIFACSNDKNTQETCQAVINIGKEHFLHGCANLLTTGRQAVLDYFTLGIGNAAWILLSNLIKHRIGMATSETTFEPFYHYEKLEEDFSSDFSSEEESSSEDDFTLPPRNGSNQQAEVPGGYGMYPSPGNYVMPSEEILPHLVYNYGQTTEVSANIPPQQFVSYPVQSPTQPDSIVYPLYTRSHSAGVQQLPVLQSIPPGYFYDPATGYYVTYSSNEQSQVFANYYAVNPWTKNLDYVQSALVPSTQ